MLFNPPKISEQYHDIYYQFLEKKNVRKGFKKNKKQMKL